MLVRSITPRLPKSVTTRASAAATTVARSFSNTTKNEEEDNPLDKPWVPNVSMDTDVVHGGVKPDKKTGAILTPVYLSTTFVQESVDKYLDGSF